MDKFKRKPLYYSEFARRKNKSLIFVAIDRMSAQTMRRLKTPCLFCEEMAEHYDLDFCIGCEVWVLYARRAHFTAAMHFARALQWIGAAKVFTILINAQLAQEIDNDQ